MSQTPTLANSVTSLTALLLPLHDRTLLLPNVAMAELVPYQTPERHEGMPDWLLGYIGWRDLTLPLLAFEVASGSRTEVGRNARIAVLNAIGDRPGTPFLALLLQGIPRSLKVDADLPSAAGTLAPLELAAVRIGDDLVKIPDLEGLEQKLADAGLI